MIETWASKVKIKWTSRESQCDNETAFVDYLFYLVSYFFLIKSLSIVISQVLCKLYVPNKYFQNQDYELEIKEGVFAYLFKSDF